MDTAKRGGQGFYRTLVSPDTISGAAGVAIAALGSNVSMKTTAKILTGHFAGHLVYKLATMPTS